MLELKTFQWRWTESIFQPFTSPSFSPWSTRKSWWSFPRQLHYSRGSTGPSLMWRLLIKCNTADCAPCREYFPERKVSWFPSVLHLGCGYSRSGAGGGGGCGFSCSRLSEQNTTRAHHQFWWSSQDTKLIQSHLSLHFYTVAMKIQKEKLSKQSHLSLHQEGQNAFSFLR